jgi:hypothetical protein
MRWVRGIFPRGVKGPGRDYHPPPSNTEVKERVELRFFPLPPLVFVAFSRMNFTVTFKIKSTLGLGFDKRV